ncbi:MAG TPA: hypothetical protein PLA69_08810 [Flavobacterium sp.]|nr:hypothetical protein [Flavobacterium sp.]
MNFKKLLFIALLAVSAVTSAQTFTFQTTGFSVMERNAKGSWGKWSDLTPANIIITLDTNKNRIVIYSQEVQLYRIADYPAQIENENDLIYPFSCVDEDGWPVDISIITRKNQNNRKQLYIKHKDVVLLYNIINYRDKAQKK